MPTPWRARAPVALLLVVGCAVVLARRPDLLAEPRFYAEDGARWYGDAFNLGPWRAAAILYGGYFQLYSRLVPAVAVLVPMRWAPRILQVAATLATMVPAAVLLSNRLGRIVPRFPVRVALAALYLALPNSFETDGNLTNAQSRLAVGALLVVLGRDPQSRAGRVADAGFLALSGVSGAFSFFMFPLAAVAWYIRRTRWSLVRAAILGACAAIQSAILLLTGVSERGHLAPLGASPGRLAVIVGGQVFLAPLIGLRGLVQLEASSTWSARVAAAVLCAGVVLVLLALRRAPWELRGLVAVSAFSLAAALAAPLASVTDPQWQALMTPGTGNRYYLLPMLSWLACLAWLAARGHLVTRLLAGGLLASVVLLAVPRDFVQEPYVDYGFDAYVTQYDALPAGEWLLVPINPPGWHLCLYKGGNGASPPVTGRLPYQLKDLVGPASHC